MNRTDRLYALVEELRAVAPRPRSAPWLAGRFEVSVRTIERDLEALRQSGLPIRSDSGRAGGYSLDRDRTLPPVTLSAAEALAISVALRTVASTPFAGNAHRAGQKVLAVLPADVRQREETLARLVHRVGDHPPDASGKMSEIIVDAVVCGHVLHLTYTDRPGTATTRDVEPLGLLWGPNGWYLAAWCRLRSAVRGFQLDRITSLESSDEQVAPRDTHWRAELKRLDAEPFTM
ncbi:putative DNA-binding transcriptional regulator YafY [Streptomyces sp. PvR006]|uniref:helix-turn-helix transcriptional regulator n=1 Tax=Streptomyces sp. PvR006 TaxID=2817860 RepID=UPI001AE473B9|nr:YafY family protein [Streptomyces sp. PvR006]MBP2587162.1 putative DNA-binding transcriptional regulator YafY [Streptomyces sp. PvR006]